MAKSPMSDQIRDLALEMRGVLEREEARERVIERLLVEFEAREEEQLAQTRRFEFEITALKIEHASLKQQLQDHLAHYQEGDRRRWTLFMALFGAVLSLAAGLIATLAKK